MFSMNELIEKFISKGKEVEKVREDNFNYEVKNLSEQQRNLMNFIIDDTQNTINILKY